MHGELRVGEQDEVEVVALAKLLQRLHIVGGDADDGISFGLETLEVVAEVLGLTRAHRRARLRVEVEHDVLVLEVRKRIVLVFVRFEFEIRCLIAFVQAYNVVFTHVSNLDPNPVSV